MVLLRGLLATTTHTDRYAHALYVHGYSDFDSVVLELLVQAPVALVNTYWQPDICEPGIREP